MEELWGTKLFERCYIYFKNTETEEKFGKKDVGLSEETFLNSTLLNGLKLFPVKLISRSNKIWDSAGHWLN